MSRPGVVGRVRAAEPVLAGNLVITVGTVRAVLYVLFFLVGAALFGLLLAVAPAILGQWGLLPT